MQRSTTLSTFYVVLMVVGIFTVSTYIPNFSIVPAANAPVVHYHVPHWLNEI